MTTYEFHGSVRIEANSENEAVDLFYEALLGYDTHINDIEEIN